MSKKNEHAQALGKLGGKARAKRLSKGQIVAIARKAGVASGKARAKRKARVSLVL